MKIYNFNPKTKEYLGAHELTEGDRNPFVKGEYLIPANAVKTWPTVKAGENQTIIFNGSGWSLIPDFRGVESWYQTGEKIEISDLGQTLPSDSIDYDPIALSEDITAEYEQAKAAAVAQAQADAQDTAEEPTT